MRIWRNLFYKGTYCLFFLNCVRYNINVDVIILCFLWFIKQFTGGTLMEEFKTGDRRRSQMLAKRRKLVSGAAVVGTGLALAPWHWLCPEHKQKPRNTTTNKRMQPKAWLIKLSTASQIAAANDLYASVMIAQALLESGNGGSTLSQAPIIIYLGLRL